MIALAERIKDFVKDQPVPRVSLLLRALATVLAETCAIAEAERPRPTGSFIHMSRCCEPPLRNSTSDYSRSSAPLQRRRRATL